MTTIKTIKEKINNNIKSSITNKQKHTIVKITDWLSSIINNNGVFISLRWYTNPPKTTAQLISRIHTTFNKLFQQLLGSHWFKLYSKNFNFVVIQEKGKSTTTYHAHVAIGIKNKEKFTVPDIVKALYAVENKMRMEVYLKLHEEVHLKKTYPDNMVITPIFNVNGVSSYISKEFNIIKSANMTLVDVDGIIPDTDIFN